MSWLAKIFSPREAATLVVATALPTILLVLLALLEGNAGEALWAAELGFAFSFVFSCIVAIPVIVILNILRIYNLIVYIVTGMLFGVVIFLYLFLPDILQFGLSDFLEGWPARAAQFIIISIFTSISALFYWLVARPDRIHGPSSALDSE